MEGIRPAGEQAAFRFISGGRARKTLGVGEETFQMPRCEGRDDVEVTRSPARTTEKPGETGDGSLDLLSRQILDADTGDIREDKQNKDPSKKIHEGTKDTVSEVR